MATGLMAVMIAAALNGIVLPLYVDKYADAGEETLEIVKYIISYGLTLNHAFDYIFIAALCLAVFFWSIAILKSAAMPSWIAYLGILYFVFCGVLAVAGFNFISLNSFAMYIFGSMVWILCAGVLLAVRQTGD
jgi:hypothetical protein